MQICEGFLYLENNYLQNNYLEINFKPPQQTFFICFQLYFLYIGTMPH